MPYNIYFGNTSSLCLEVGFNSFKEAKAKLEELANCLGSGSKASGRITFKKNSFKKIMLYDITYVSDRAYLTPKP